MRRSENLSKYNIGQILKYSQDVEIESIIGNKKSLIKKGTKVYIGADNFAHYASGNIQRLNKTDVVEGYSVKGIADWVFMWLSSEFPIDEFLDGYEISEEEFQEKIADALEELGMWDNTGNRS
jgi:hypothetical protein